jgi:hypothetical protein
VSDVPECPNRDGWKWLCREAGLCRAKMVNGPYGVRWYAPIPEWFVVEGGGNSEEEKAGPFDNADDAMDEAERLATGPGGTSRPG